MMDCSTVLVVRYGYLSAQCVDAADDLPEVLVFIEVDGLEEIGLGDTKRFAGGEEVADVLHLLERHLGRVHLDFPACHLLSQSGSNKIMNNLIIQTYSCSTKI
jgi:hypothetical protein